VKKYLEIWTLKKQEVMTNIKTDLKKILDIDVNFPNFGFSGFKSLVLEQRVV
jgi:hypothetical protein